MPSPRRHWWALFLVLAAAALVIAPVTAAEWAWSAASSDDEPSCWGSPEECPVVYDLDDAAGVLGRRRLQYFYDVNTAAALAPSSSPSTAAQRFISYGALMRDSVPCSVPGASYYNCRPPAADANPYTRGCSAITQCRE